MLDIKFIRENPELVKQAVKNKNESADIDRILEIDRQRRNIIAEVEKLKALRNSASEQIAVKKRNKQDATEDIARMKEVGDLEVDDTDVAKAAQQVELRLSRLEREADGGGDLLGQHLAEESKSEERAERVVEHGALRLGAVVGEQREQLGEVPKVWGEQGGRGLGRRLGLGHVSPFAHGEGRRCRVWSA